MTNSLKPTDQDIQDFLSLGCLPEEIISELGVSLEQVIRVFSKLPISQSDDFSSTAEIVIAAFKKNLAGLISEHDAATHFDLGIAFKEMSLYDEAFEDFIIASLWPERYGECMMMASLCMREKGDNFRAVETCRIALSSGIMGKEAAALYYELGQALLALGCNENALWAISQGESLDPQFSDLTVLLANLKGINPVPISLNEPFTQPLS